MQLRASTIGGMQTQDFEQLRQQTAQAVREVLEAAHLSAGDIFVIGCSSSEVLGEQIGTHTSMDVAPYLFGLGLFIPICWPEALLGFASGCSCNAI